MEYQQEHLQRTIESAEELTNLIKNIRTGNVKYTIKEKEAEIKNFCNDYNLKRYIKLTNKEDIENVFELLDNEIVREDIENLSGMCLFYYGLFYQYCEEPDYNKMKKYYLKAIEKDNIHALRYLTRYYEDLSS